LEMGETPDCSGQDSRHRNNLSFGFEAIGILRDR
jgi:hypothetical protein